LSAALVVAYTAKNVKRIVDQLAFDTKAFTDVTEIEEGSACSTIANVISCVSRSNILIIVSDPTALPSYLLLLDYLFVYNTLSKLKVNFHLAYVSLKKERLALVQRRASLREKKIRFTRK